MRFQYFRAYLLLIVSFCITNGHADNLKNIAGTSYFGGGLGVASYPFMKDYADDLSQIVDAFDDKVYTVDVDDKPFAFSGFWGYSITEIFGAELSYINFGESEVQYSETVFSSPSVTIVESYKDTAEIQGWGLAGTARLPIVDRVSVYGKLGVMFWEFESNLTEITYENGKQIDYLKNPSSSFDATDPFIALGVELEVIPNWSIYGDWHYLHGSYQDENAHIHTYMAGVKYRFGGLSRYRSKSAAGSGDEDSNRQRAITACDPEFKDISGLVCDEE
jgi:opacity protein-like surface antigen